jgi:hypothetical protein
MSARVVLVVFCVALSGMLECCFAIFEVHVLTVTNIFLIKSNLARNDDS